MMSLGLWRPGSGADRGEIRIALTQAGGATWNGLLLEEAQGGGRSASIELSRATASDANAKAQFQLLLSPASANNLEKTLRKLRP